MLIRIFPHSKEEFEDEIALKYWLAHILPYERKGRYLLRSTGRVGKIPPGSVVLFRFGNNIVGSAVVQQDVESIDETIDGVHYEGRIRFDTNSVKVYDCSIPIEFLEDLTQRPFAVARTYFKIELNKN
jgi:hypothetical protein